MYLQADGTIKPKPLNPANVANDKAKAAQAFNNFKNAIQSKVKDSYTNDVTYREESDINTIGTRLDFDITDNSTIGLDINYLEEDRDGSYNGNFHPMGFIPPLGHPKNPIVGYDNSGDPISMFQKMKKVKGKCPAFDVPVNSKDENRRLDIGLDYQTAISEDLFLKLRAYSSYYKKRNTTTMKHYKDFGYPNEAKSASNGMNANVDIKTYEAVANYNLTENHFLTAGVEKRDEKREATVFDNTPNMTEKKVDYKAIYLQDEWDVTDSLNAVIGARYDEISNADNKATFKLGVTNSFSTMANLRVLVAQGYRTPDIREMYINKQTPRGLQQGADVVKYNLKPEFTNSYEIGLGGRNNKLSYDAALFLNKIKDRISQVKKQNKNNTGEYYTFENISKAETKGLELSLNYDILKNLSTGISYTKLDTEDKKKKRDLEFNPEQTASFNLNYTPIESLSFLATVNYVGEQKYYEKNKAKKEVEKTTDDFTLVDLNINYAINKTYSIYVGVNNVFDKEVDDILGSNVGTFYFTGLRAKF
ncbi:MAG: hypothetical protein CSA86_04170 [Arcobacter sp.]|nr:MAG: hypothetical protein CSA86_04170 [Arcobacter sp.]